MWKLLINLLFLAVGIKGEDPNCEDCNDAVDLIIEEHLPYILKDYEPFKTSIPDCEHCDIGDFKNVSRNNDSCVTEVEGFKVQITHLIFDSAVLNCSCDMNTKSGKKRGGIHGTIEKPMYSIKIVSRTGELGKFEFYEDGHIGADKLHIICDGDDDLMKACEEEEHSYNIDNVVIAVGNTIVEVLNSVMHNELKKQFQCFFFDQ